MSCAPLHATSTSPCWATLLVTATVSVMCSGYGYICVHSPLSHTYATQSGDQERAVRDSMADLARRLWGLHARLRDDGTRRMLLYATVEFQLVVAFGNRTLAALATC